MPTANLSIAFYSWRAKNASTVTLSDPEWLFSYDLPFSRYSGAKSTLIFGPAGNSATFKGPLQRRLVTDRLHIWWLDRSYKGVAPSVTLDDLDLLLWHWHTFNGNFRNWDLAAGFLQDTSGARTCAIAFRSKTNMNCASYSRRAKGVHSYRRLFSYDLPFSRYRLQSRLSVLGALGPPDWWGPWGVVSGVGVVVIYTSESGNAQLGPN